MTITLQVVLFVVWVLMFLAFLLSSNENHPFLEKIFINV